MTAEALHGEGVIRKGGRRIQELAKTSIVASAGHVEARADLRFLGAGKAPPGSFEIEDGAIARRELHRATSIAATTRKPGDISCKALVVLVTLASDQPDGGPEWQPRSEPGVGLEPTTSALQERCSTS